MTSILRSHWRQVLEDLDCTPNQRFDQRSCCSVAGGATRGGYERRQGLVQRADQPSCFSGKRALTLLS